MSDPGNPGLVAALTVAATLGGQVPCVGNAYWHRL